MPALHHAHLAEIDPRTVYLLAMLRQDVFTLEQGATDADLDGRELDASTELLWFSQPGPLAARAGLDSAPIAHLRILHDGDVVRIGRVAVHSAHRGGGLGRALMDAALTRIAEVAPQAEVHLDAQAHLEQWYASMGFETMGGVFLEAGIEHVAMLRRPAARA